MRRECEHCDGTGEAWISRRGGNDPDGDFVPCPVCRPQNPRERDEDDGVTYADPHEEIARRERL